MRDEVAGVRRRAEGLRVAGFLQWCCMSIHSFCEPRRSLKSVSSRGAREEGGQRRRSGL